MTSVDDILKAPRLHKSFRERAKEAAALKEQERKAQIEKDCDNLEADVEAWLAKLNLTAEELWQIKLERGLWGNYHGMLTWNIEGLPFRAYYSQFPDGRTELIIDVSTAPGIFRQVEDLADVGAAL
jgi:hypothetical protein